MERRGLLLVVSGFSGAGKGTLMKKLLEDYENYALSVSATTRSPREGEVDGREYFFLQREEFLKLIETDALYEYAEYAGNFYGTPKHYVDEKLAEGKDVLLEIEVQGAEKIKKQFPDTVLIFVTPPTARELKRRLVSRGTESEDKIVRRLNRAVEEAKYMPFYDYVLVNDDMEESVKDLHAIISSERARSARNREFILQITDELKEVTN